MPAKTHPRAFCAGTPGRRSVGRRPSAFSSPWIRGIMNDHLPPCADLRTLEDISPLSLRAGPVRPSFEEEEMKLSFDRTVGAVVAEDGAEVLKVTDWSIDQELFCVLTFNDARWNVVAYQKQVPAAGGGTRLGWEVFRIVQTGGPAQAPAPTDVITAALKAYGYLKGRGHDEDVPVVFALK